MVMLLHRFSNFNHLIQTLNLPLVWHMGNNQRDFSYTWPTGSAPAWSSHD